ncbi:hypothetical protein [Streptomyces sp. NPDC088254]|uniref:hypothetical protein n=1 Tax=Streptomyces sp. NPDC088254 TaxID=3365847 RepID=UPI0038015D35
MVEWVPMRVGARPVPPPLATPLVWATASGDAVVLPAAHYALLGPDRPGPALAARRLLAALLGRCARFTAAPGTALLCWLLRNGFALPPPGTLTWAGQRDALRLGCPGAATLLGTAPARLRHARAAHRRARARHPGDAPRRRDARPLNRPPRPTAQ